MRRAIARGRVVPQRLSTDANFGELSLKGVALFPLMWINADDQGRLTGNPAEIKYSCCPNIEHITKQDIPEILEELEAQGFIKVYVTNKSKATQILSWWQDHKPQWAWPSEYPPQDGWQDKLRYKRGAKEVITFNWFSPENSPDASPENSPEQKLMFPLTTPHLREKGKRDMEKDITEEGEGNSPERSGENSTPTLIDLPLLNKFMEIFPEAFGKQPNSREVAQIRDLANELSSSGGATATQVFDAFKEACGQAKFSVSYVRAVLRAWLGVDKE